MFKYLLSFTIFVTTSTSYGVCNNPVTFLQENEKVPCSGYLFTPEKELEVRTKITNYERLENVIQKQDLLIDVLNKRVDNQIQQNINLSNELQRKENETYWQKAGFFLLGAILTGVIAYGTVQSLK